MGPFDNYFYENEVHRYILLVAGIVSVVRFLALIRGKEIKCDWAINPTEFSVFLFCALPVSL